MTEQQTIQTNLDLSRYSINQLYNLLCLGILSRAEYVAELDARTDADGNINF